MSEHRLKGLDGSNPLAFLAACGLLRWLTEEDPEPERGPITLRWERDGAWRPVIGGVAELDAVIARIAADAPRWVDAPAFSLVYDKKGKQTYDLKPPPDRMRAWLESVVHDRTGAAFASAFGVAEALDNNGNVKPTALHFAAGQQVWLEMARAIGAGVRPADLDEALRGPWRYDGLLPSMSWDATAARDYALRAGNPSKEKRQGVPGADWLALQALPLFPVAAGRGGLATACTGGRWKNGRFRWPIWEAAAGLSAVRRLLLVRDLERWSERERALRGVAAVLACDIRRSDQGGYGSFGPARPASKDDGTGR